MSSLLRLYLPAQWPSEDTSCDWDLLDAGGHQLQRGRSEARHWPQADECEVILSAEQCLLLTVQLPAKVAKSRLAEVVRFAVEEFLIGDADTEHFVIGAKDASGETPVWVISRARLKSILTALATLGRTPQRAYSEIQLLPFAADEWSVCVGEVVLNEKTSQACRGFARTGREQGFAFEVEDLETIASPPVELQLALRKARDAGSSPRSLALYLVAGSSLAAEKIAASWQAELGLPVQAAGEFVWQAHQAEARTATNFLSEEFAPPRRPHEGLGLFRPALYIAAATCVLAMLFVFGDWIWLRYQSSNLQKQMTATFRSAFPQQTVVDPPLQMQRLYDQQRREQGQLGSNDFLPLFAAATDIAVGQGRLNKLSYADGRLELSIIVASRDIAERLRDTMTSRGLAVTLRDAQPLKAGGQGIEAVYALRSTQ